MNSRILECRVLHARGEPVRHRFEYRLYLYAFDLSELAELDRRIAFFGYNRRRPVSLWDADYLDRGEGAVREKLRSLLQRVGVADRADRVILVSAARYFGYVFNPVSFFFGYGANRSLEFVVAQVNNTFGETHAYVLTSRGEPRPGFVGRYRAEKVFHVSPFFPRIGEYEFHVADPRRKLEILIQYRQEGRQVFAARLTGTPRRLTAGSLALALVRSPVAPWLTLPRILRQAGRLRYGKKLPVFRKPNPSSPLTLRAAAPGPLRRAELAAVFRVLRRMRNGRLTVQPPVGPPRSFGDPDRGRQAEIRVASYDFFRRTLLRGEIGFGESFVAGDWECDDLTQLLRLFVDNWDVASERRLPTAAVGRAVAWIRHLGRANTLRRSPQNVREHYDRSNEFFQTFLDDSLTYSCALFRGPEDTLEEAQQNKLAKIIEKARITADCHVLEIGCGWGSFAIEAARRTGCRVTGISLSQEQLALGREKVAEAGLEGRVRLEYRDYRKVNGSYDRIVSIEMLEAVGHAHLGQFFRVCDRALAAEGLAVLQVITIPDQRYAAYRQSSDWIREHIFPGGHLPSLTALSTAMTRHSNLTVDDLENIGIHYARTLREWRQRLLANRDRIRALGFDEAAVRKWVYYFSYCEAGFSSRVLNDLQLVLTRAGNPTLARAALGTS